MKRLLTFVLMFIIASVFLVDISYGADEERFIPSDLVVKDRKAYRRGYYRIWTRDASIIGNAMTWDNAFKAVKNLNEQKYAGLQCWRLPEKEELLSLSDYIVQGVPGARNTERSRVGFKDIGLFKNVQLNLYWSATHRSANDIWVVDMSLGSASEASKTGLRYVWPVCDDYDKKEIEEDERQIAEEKRRKAKEQEEENEKIKQQQAQQEAQRKESEEKQAQQRKLEEKKKKEAALAAELKKREEEKRKQQKIIAQKQKQKEKIERLLPQCNNEILTHEDFLLGKNPYADKGKCVKFTAATFQMTSANTGLFDIGNNELAFIEFKETFRGSGVQGIAKIKGLYNYTTRAGISNQVPHLEMLEIEKILGR